MLKERKETKERERETAREWTPDGVDCDLSKPLMCL